jgi:hypothetical protein
VVTFTTNGQFTWQQTNPLTGQVTTVQATYALGLLLQSSSEIDLTLVSQGQIFLQGRFAQPGPGEFILEIFGPNPFASAGFILFNRQSPGSHRRRARRA